MHVVSVRSHSPDGTTQEVPRVPQRMVLKAAQGRRLLSKKVSGEAEIALTSGTVEAPQTVKLVKAVLLMRTKFTGKTMHIVVLVCWCYAQACACSQFRAPLLGLVTKVMDPVVVSSAFGGAEPLQLSPSFFLFFSTKQVT